MTARANLLRAYYVASFIALGFYLPYFPSWLEARGIEGVAMGAIAATSPAMGLLGPPLFGALADALGRPGGLLRVAAAGAFGAFALIAIAAVFGRTLTYVELFGLTLAFAFFRAPMSMLADVVALDLASAGVTSYGRFRLWGSIGFLAGAVFAGRFVDVRQPASLPLGIAAGLLAAAISAFTLPAGKVAVRNPLRGSVRLLLADRDFRFFLVTAVAAQGAHSAYDLCFTLLLRDRGFPRGSIGVAWAIGVVAEVVLMATSGRLLRRLNPGGALAFALGAAAFRWMLLATLRSPVALLVAQPLHGLSFGLYWLASIEFTRRRAPRAALGTAQGLFAAANAVGSALGMIAWGTLYRAAGGGVTFAAASLVSLVGAGSALLLSRSRVAGAIA